MPDPHMIKDGKNRTRKALLLIALIVGMLAVLTFAAPYNQFLQKAAQPVTGNTNEITYCHLVQKRERLDQKLIICRFNLLNDLPKYRAVIESAKRSAVDELQHL